MALGRHLGVSYNTAWLLKHKIMEAMRERVHTSMTGGGTSETRIYWGNTACRGGQNAIHVVIGHSRQDASQRYLACSPDRFNRVRAHAHDAAAGLSLGRSLGAFAALK